MVFCNWIAMVSAWRYHCSRRCTFCLLKQHVNGYLKGKCYFCCFNYFCHLDDVNVCCLAHTFASWLTQISSRWTHGPDTTLPGVLGFSPWQALCLLIIHEGCLLSDSAKRMITISIASASIYLPPLRFSIEWPIFLSITSLLVMKKLWCLFSSFMSLTCLCCYPKPFGMRAAMPQTRVCVDPTRSHNAPPLPLSGLIDFEECVVVSPLPAYTDQSPLSSETCNEIWPCFW